MIVLTFSACTKELENINKNGNTSANIMNLGYVALQGDWMYYYYQSNWTIKEGLYKSTKDGKQRNKIESGRISSINVIGNWIYYIKAEKDLNYPNKSIEKYSLYKIQVNGLRKTKLLEDCGFVNIIGSQIYYSIDTSIELFEKSGIEYPLIKDFGNIYRADLKNLNNRKLIKKNVLRYFINNNYLYYFKNSNGIHSGIYKFDLKTGTETEVIKKQVYDFAFQEDLIFYIENASKKYTINCYSQVSGKTKTLYCSDIQIEQIFSTRNYVIFKEVKGKVVKFKLNDTKNILNIGTADYIYVFDDTIVFWKHSKFPTISTGDSSVI